jgi:tripartite motif-containing protein 71
MRICAGCAMRTDCARFYQRAARVAVLVFAIISAPLTAQDLLIAEARPGPEYGGGQDQDLSMPSDVAIGTEGRVYVVDSGHHRIALYDTAGNSLAYFGSEGKEEGQLQGPVGIAAGPDGSVYVADRGNQRLQAFAADGTFLKTLALLEEGQAVTPVGIAVAADGKSLFVTANNNHRVLSVDRKGRVRSGWGGEGKDPGQFRYPATLALDNSGNVLVVDVLNQRIQVFDATGTAMAEFGKLGAKPGNFIRPKGVAVDGGGRIFVSDSYLGVVQVFTSDGTFAGVLGTNGEPVRFEAPTGLAFAAGRLYVTDMLAGKVLSYDMENDR